MAVCVAVAGGDELAAFPLDVGPLSDNAGIVTTGFAGNDAAPARKLPTGLSSVAFDISPMLPAGDGDGAGWIRVMPGIVTAAASA